MNKITYKDVQYNSLADLCRKLGKEYGTVRSRLINGMSLQQAIEAPTQAHKDSRLFTVEDHNGNTFASRRKMAAAYGITVQLLDWRLKHGWSLDRALTEKVTPRGRSHCKLPPVDHNGTVYDSPQDMCSYYGIPLAVVTRRLYEGWSLEKTLTTPYRKYRAMEYV